MLYYVIILIEFMRSGCGIISIIPMYCIYVPFEFQYSHICMLTKFSFLIDFACYLFFPFYFECSFIFFVILKLSQGSYPLTISLKSMQLEETEKRLNDSQSKLARLRSNSNAVSSKGAVQNGTKKLKVERRSPSPIRKSEDSSRHQPQSKPELLIPSVNPRFSQPINLARSSAKASSSSSTQSSPSFSTQSYSAMKSKGDIPSRVSSEEVVNIQEKVTKRKFGETHFLNSVVLLLLDCVIVHV